MTHNRAEIAIIVMYLLCLLSFKAHPGLADSTVGAFTPGEKLTYELSWENIPAGKLQLEIRPITTIDQQQAYHFVLIAKSNGFVDLFCKIRDRMEAYANLEMTHSLYYQKKQTGKRTRLETIVFDWQNNKAHYTKSGRQYDPIDLAPGSFDPLSAFYVTRLRISEKNPKVVWPVTNGKKSYTGYANLVRRETITLKSGKSYDTFCLEPDMGLFGGVFKDSTDPQLHVWVTVDERRLPVRIKSKVKVGNFIGELTSVEGVQGDPM